MISTIFTIIYLIVEVYMYVFMVYIILSWFPVSDNIFVKAVRGVCEPVYGFILKNVPRLRIGMMDFSPFYIVILCYLIQALCQRMIIMFR